MADRPAARAWRARREVRRRQRPVGAKHCRRAQPQRRVLVDGRRGSAVPAVPVAAADHPPAQRAHDGRRRHARGRRGRDRRPAYRQGAHVRDPVCAGPRGAVCGRHPQRRHRRCEHGPQVMAVGVARAGRRGARARDDLVAGLGVDARPSVLGRHRAGPGDRVPVRSARDRTSRAAAAHTRRQADPQPRPVVVQPVPDPRADRRDRLREARCRPRQPGRPGVPRLARHRAAADDHFRAAVRVGVREAVLAPAQHPRAPRLRLPRAQGAPV